MVLGVGKTAAISRLYESLFVQELTELGISTDSMHLHINRDKLVTEDEIVKILTENNFDSIIVTRLISATEHFQTVSVDQYPDYYWHYYGFYNYAYNYAEIEEYTEYELETNLYDVKTRKLVWLTRKQVTSNHSEEGNMKNIIKAAIKNLQRENMIVK
jgi:hypothetical protein